MKKNVLALSIATAVVGFAGSAHAITDAAPIPSTATDLRFGQSNAGHILLVPYFTAQGDNATLLTLVNTDTVNGKAVKVRFRGAKNSDDIFDFQVFMSPGDVWTANVSKGSDGRAKLTTADTSCTKPEAVKNSGGNSFVTTRLNKNAADIANDTREGYVEIFNMADIPSSTTGLYPLIKHPSQKAPGCADSGTNTTWTALDTDRSTATLKTFGLSEPTGGLMANWNVMNVPKALSWTGTAISIEATDAAGNPAKGAIVYSPQTDEFYGGAGLAAFTADPLFASGYVQPLMFDLPDLSTPYAGTTTARAQADLVSKSIAALAISNEYWNESIISSETDWVFAMPTRRYNVAVDYNGTAANAFKPQIIYAAGTTYFTSANVTMDSDGDKDRICTRGVGSKTWDREENGSSAGGTVISPGNAAAPFCGEVTVIDFNNAGASSTETLGASVAIKHIDSGSATAGWAQLTTPGNAGLGLPMIGYAFVKANNPNATKGTNGNYSLTWEHRYSRPAK